MSLSSVLYTAQSSLANTSRQTSVVSRNITNVHNLDYTRREAVLISTAPGARVISITRAADAALMRQNGNALSAWHAQSTLMAGFERLAVTVNGADNASSPAMRMGALQEALQTYATSPGNEALARNAIDAASDVVRSLNEGTQAIRQLRSDAELEIGQSVDKLNTLLADLETINADVTKATRLGRDASEALDIRDGIVKQIAELIPITTHTRGDNDMVVFSRDGATLFETVAYEAAYATLPDGRGEISVGGIALFADITAHADASGSMVALLRLRDDVAPTQQKQLDEIARGLIRAFSESDGTSETAGLFTFPGIDPTPPHYTAGTMLNAPVPGLAGLIRINPTYSVEPTALRDGVVFPANPDNDAGNAAQVQRFIDAFDESRDFDADSGVVATTLSAYATGSIGWLEDGRKTTNLSVEKTSAMLARSSEALSNKTGVNIDEELARLLDLEQSYAASAKLLQVANEMLATLMATVR